MASDNIFLSDILKEFHKEAPISVIAAIRAALIEAEESAKQEGYSEKSIDKVWEEAKTKYRARHG